jgi:hypothetical protein
MLLRCNIVEERPVVGKGSRKPRLPVRDRALGCLDTAEVADRKRSVRSIPVAPTSQGPSEHWVPAYLGLVHWWWVGPRSVILLRWCCVGSNLSNQRAVPGGWGNPATQTVTSDRSERGSLHADHHHAAR